MIDKMKEKFKNHTFDRGDFMIIGSFIGYLMSSIFSMTYFMPLNPLGNSTPIWFQHNYITRTAIEISLLPLLGIGLFLKDNWKTKIFGAMVLYFALRVLYGEILKIGMNLWWFKPP